MTDTQLDHVRFHESGIPRRIADAVRAVDQDNAQIGLLSTEKQCAVALVLERPDVAVTAYGTLPECAVRIGSERLAASLFVQANGWTEAELDLA